MVQLYLFAIEKCFKRPALAKNDVNWFSW